MTSDGNKNVQDRKPSQDKKPNRLDEGYANDSGIRKIHPSITDTVNPLEGREQKPKK